jgi:mannose-6-phosphate isomerase-like protein (cupin superfamily)
MVIMREPNESPVRRFRPDGEAFQWEAVATLDYKQGAEAVYRDITRQTLFRSDELAGELRYFEIAAGGHSTLERHEHVHAVVILRGMGACLVGTDVQRIGAYDLVTIPALTWHQFRAAANAPLGFLCLVNAQRDPPQLPDAAAVAELAREPRIAAFLRGELPG